MKEIKKGSQPIHLRGFDLKLYSNGIQSVLNEISKSISYTKLSAWEKQFVSSLDFQVYKGSRLSKKQQVILKRIYDTVVIA